MMLTSLVVNAGSTSHKLALLELMGEEQLPCLWQALADWGDTQVGGLVRWRCKEQPWQQDTLSLDLRCAVLLMGRNSVRPWTIYSAGGRASKPMPVLGRHLRDSGQPGK